MKSEVASWLCSSRSSQFGGCTSAGGAGSPAEALNTGLRLQALKTRRPARKVTVAGVGYSHASNHVAQASA